MRYGKTRILIVDDQEIAREGLRALLEAESDFEVVGEATDGDEVVDRVRVLKPDVVLMDVRMRRVSGLEATRLLKRSWPRVVVIIVTMHEDIDYLLEAIEAGAAGYLLKDTPRAQLIEAIRATVSGGSLISPVVLRVLLERLAQMPLASSYLHSTSSSAEQSLSPREREVVRLLGRGLSNKEIASQLGIGESTVKTHVERIFRKLDVSDRTQAAIWSVTASRNHAS